MSLLLLGTPIFTIAYNRYVPDREHVIELLERGQQREESRAGTQGEGTRPALLSEADAPCEA